MILKTPEVDDFRGSILFPDEHLFPFKGKAVAVDVFFCDTAFHQFCRILLFLNLAQCLGYGVLKAAFSILSTLL